jgi:hypothetical protein
MIKAPHYLILMGKYRDIKHDGTNPKTILGQAKLKRTVSQTSHTDKVSQIVSFLAALTIYLVIVQQNQDLSGVCIRLML